MKTQLNTRVPTAEDALDVLKSAGYFPKVVKYSPRPTVAYSDGLWRFEPTDEVHPYATSGVAALVASGVPIAGYVMAHEIEPIVTEQEKKDDFKIESVDIAPIIGVVVAVVGLIFMGLLHALITLDPAFIVVLDDDLNTWIEVVNWKV